MRKNYKETIGGIQRALHWWKRKVAHTVEKIDGYVKHSFREHNQEAGLHRAKGKEEAVYTSKKGKRRGPKSYKKEGG